MLAEWVGDAMDDRAEWKCLRDDLHDFIRKYDRQENDTNDNDASEGGRTGTRVAMRTAARGIKLSVTWRPSR